MYFELWFPFKSGPFLVRLQQVSKDYEKKLSAAGVRVLLDDAAALVLAVRSWRKNTTPEDEGL